MSDITSVLLDRVRTSESRLSKLETQEGDYYSRAQTDATFLTIADANSTFLTITDAYANFLDISAYGDFLLNTGQATGALIYPQWFSRGVIAGDGVWGSEVANGDLILEGTSHATKVSSYVILQPTSGKVGIGTSAPDEKLHVSGGGVLLDNNNWYKAKNTGGTAVYLLGIDGNNDVFMGAVGNAGGAVYIREDGSNVITITGGNVGVGTGTPGEKLSVAGQLAVGGALQDVYTKYSTDSRSWWTGVGAIGGDDKFVIYDSTATAIRMTVDTSGRVGIGTTSPLHTLSVYSATDNIIHMSHGNNANWNAIDFLPAGALSSSNIEWAWGVYPGTSNLVAHSWDGTNAYIRFAIAADGNVGIGTRAPGYILEIAKGAKGTFGEQARLQLRTADASNQLTTAWRLIGGTTPYTVIESVEQGVAYRAISMQPDGGNVGIGTTSPSEKLSVASSINVGHGVPADVYTKHQTDSRSWWTGIGYSSGDDKYIVYDNTASLPRLIIDTAGKVGLGTSTPDARLDVQVNSGGGSNGIEVSQEDTSYAFMNFVSTDVASSGSHLVNTAAVGTYYGKLRIAVNGTQRYIPLYNS